MSFELFSTDFMPHGYCFLWDPGILWLHVSSDLAIALAYFSIPLSLIVMVRRRGDMKFSPIFYMFSAFIFLCGVTHLFNVIVIWHGIYGIAGLAKLATAIISVITAVAAWRLIPAVAAIPSQARLERVVAERTAELARKSAQFELVINKISPAIIGVDADGLIRLVNPAATELFGADREAMLGQPVETLVPVYARERHPGHRRQFFADMRARPMGQGMELHAQRQDGTLFPVEIGLTPLTGDPDLMVLATVVDISERLKQAAERRHMAAIIQCCDDAIFSTDLNGTIQSWNPGAERLFGHLAHEMAGAPLAALMPRRDEDVEARELTRIFTEISRGEAISHHETRQRRRGGELLDVSLSISPVRNPQGQIVGAAFIARDITAAKAAADELRTLNRELAQSNEALDQFVYIAAHDLKEPLRGIHNLSSIVIEDCMDAMDDEHREDLATVARLAERMERLINDLRDYSRIDGRRQPEDLINCDAAIAAVVEEMETLAGDTRVNIQVKGQLPVAKFSGTYLSTIFRNLVSNALKYNEAEEKRVEISGRALDGAVEFTVKDNGIGIPAEYQDRVFEMFRRFHGASQYGGGTGAGLAIVKRIVEQHGGEISLSSTPGEGTEFRFTLTCHAEEMQ